MPAEQLLWVLVGAGAGIAMTTLLAWLLLRQQRHDWQQQLDQAKASQQQLSEQLSCLQASDMEARLELAAQRERLITMDRVEEELFQREEELEQLRTRLAEQLAESRSRETEMKLQQQNHGEKLALLESARESLQLEFKQLARQIFEDNGQRFGQQQQEKIQHLLQPLRQQLGEFRQRVDDVYERETRDRQGLKQQIEQLKSLNQQMSQDAVNLTNALKGEAKTQGNWGELVLSRVLEQSGLRAGEEFELQPSFTDAAGKRFQPDVLINLPDNKVVLVDAKVSLVAYERYRSADVIEQQQQALAEHVLSIKRHIRGLSDKNYQQLDGVRSLDFVVLFIPIEGAFMSAIEADNELFNQAFERNILLVSPSTLLVTLRTINNIWRHEKQNQNALLIARRGGELYDKLVGFVESLEDVGRHLRQADAAFDLAQRRLHTGKGNLVARADELRELGARTRKKLPDYLADSAADESE